MRALCCAFRDRDRGAHARDGRRAARGLRTGGDAPEEDLADRTIEIADTAALQEFRLRLR
jgi:hypothetical protein